MKSCKKAVSWKWAALDKKNRPEREVKKTIFRFWLTNILASVVLFVAYRVVISESNQADGSFLENVLQVLDVLLNLAYSFVYVIAILFCSLTLFLNLIDRIRNHFYLSLLTFLGIPIFCVVFILATGLIDSSLFHISAVGNLLIFSIIYLLFTTLQFCLFRKRVKF